MKNPFGAKCDSWDTHSCDCYCNLLEQLEKCCRIKKYLSVNSYNRAIPLVQGMCKTSEKQADNKQVRIVFLKHTWWRRQNKSEWSCRSTCHLWGIWYFSSAGMWNPLGATGVYHQPAGPPTHLFLTPFLLSTMQEWRKPLQRQRIRKKNNL